MADDPRPSPEEIERQARNLEAEVRLRERSDRSWRAWRRWLFVRTWLIAAAIPGGFLYAASWGDWRLVIGPVVASVLASIAVTWWRPSIPLALAVYSAAMVIIAWPMFYLTILGEGLFLMVILAPISIPVLVGTGLIVGWAAQSIDEH